MFVAKFVMNVQEEYGLLEWPIPVIVHDLVQRKCRYHIMVEVFNTAVFD